VVYVLRKGLVRHGDWNLVPSLRTGVRGGSRCLRRSHRLSVSVIESTLRPLYLQAASRAPGPETSEDKSEGNRRGQPAIQPALRSRSRARCAYTSINRTPSNEAQLKSISINRSMSFKYSRILSSRTANLLDLSDSIDSSMPGLRLYF
jgi:hypothetical protein